MSAPMLIREGGNKYLGVQASEPDLRYIKSPGGINVGRINIGPDFRDERRGNALYVVKIDGPEIWIRRKG